MLSPPTCGFTGFARELNRCSWTHYEAPLANVGPLRDDALYWTELVLKVMDAGYCLYVHIFMKNIKSLKPFNVYNSNQLTPDLRFQQSRRDN